MQNDKGLLKFQLFGIPVEIAPSFWVIAVLLGAGGDPTMDKLAAWVLAVTISILVHELGHGLTAKYFGAAPAISLLSTGGLTSHQPLNSRSRDIFVILAGPAAGFLFIAALTGILWTAGIEPHASSSLPWLTWSSIDQPFVKRLMFNMAYINIGWGLINLFPVLPLDGGQFMQRVLEIFNSDRSVEWSLAISTIVGAGVAGYFYYQFGSLFMLMVFGYLATVSGTAFWQHRKGMHP